MASPLKKRFIIAMIPASLLALSGTAMLWHSLFVSEQKMQGLMKVQDLAKQSRLGIVEESNALRGILINPKSEKDIGDKIRSGQAKRQALEEVKTISQSQDVLKLAQELIDFDEKHLLPAETVLQKLILDRRKKEARSFLNRQFQPMRDLYDELSAALVTTAQTEARVLLEARQREIFWTLGLVGFGFLLIFIIFSILSWNVRDLIRSGIRHLKNEYNELWNTAQNMAEMSQDVAEGFSEQQEGLGAITTSVKEIDDTFQRNVANVRRAQEKTTHSLEVSRRGQEVMEKMIQTFDQLSDNHRMVMEQVNEGNARVQEIVQVINEISKKTQVINEIVFQTKLLSFNASIEAARAGEHGKGFSVVASEIGKLASMSGEAAKGISSMLDGSVQKVEEIVADTRNQVSHLAKSGQDRLEAGAAVAEDCRISLEEIVSSVDQVRSIAKEMAQESQSQASGLQDLSECIQRLQVTGQKNVTQALEASGNVHNLIAQTEELKYAIKMIAFSVDGYPQKKHRLLEQHSGMSLVEVMVSVGIIAALCLGLMSMITFSMRGMKGVETLSNMSSLIAEMSLTITSNNACKNALGGQMPDVDQQLKFMDASGKIVLAEKGKTLNGLEIEGVSFKSVQNITNPKGPDQLNDRYLGELSVRATRNENQVIGGSMKERIIPILFTKKAVGGPIDECSIKGFLEFRDTPPVHGEFKYNGGGLCPGAPPSRDRCMTINSQCPPGFVVLQCLWCYDSDPRPAYAPIVKCTKPISTSIGFHSTGLSPAEVTASLQIDPADTCSLTVTANFPVDTDMTNVALDPYNMFEGRGLLLSARCINAYKNF